MRLATVSGAYFRTLGMALARGGGFAGRDRPGEPRLAVINQTMARTVFGGLDVVGHRFRFDPVWPSACRRRWAPRAC